MLPPLWRDPGTGGGAGSVTVSLPTSFLHSQILKLLKGKVVVGHALRNDFQALKYVHPRSQTRDTTYVPSLLQQPGLHTRARVSLKDLALQLLHKKIQVCGTGQGAGVSRGPAGAAPPGSGPPSSPGGQPQGCFLHRPSSPGPRSCGLLASSPIPRPRPGSVPALACGTPSGQLESRMGPSSEAASNSCPYRTPRYSVCSSSL